MPLLIYDLITEIHVCIEQIKGFKALLVYNYTLHVVNNYNNVSLFYK